MSEAPQPVFNIEKLFVKDLSLEVPNAPAIYLEREAPQIDVNMSTESHALSEDMFHTRGSGQAKVEGGVVAIFLQQGPYFNALPPPCLFPLRS